MVVGAVRCSLGLVWQQSESHHCVGSKGDNKRLVMCSNELIKKKLSVTSS